MANYTGTITVAFEANAAAGLHLVGSKQVSWEIDDVTQHADGSVTAVMPLFSGSIETQVWQGMRWVDALYIMFALPTLEFTTTRDAFALPLAPFQAEFGDAWTQSTQLSADLSAITFTGGGRVANSDGALWVDGTVSVTGTLALDNSMPRFGISVLEPDAVEGAATGARYIITRSGNTAIEASVDWAAVPATGQGWPVGPVGLTREDFPERPPTWPAYEKRYATNGRVDFAPGETTKTIEIVAADDAHDEADEGFIVKLSTPADLLFGLTNEAAGRIVDNDNPATVTLIPLTPDRTEGEGGAAGTFAEFRIHRDGGTAGTASVWYVVHGDDPRPAHLQDDFDSYNAAYRTGITGPDGTGNMFEARFAAGQSDIDVSLPIADDTIAERPEGYRIDLLNPSIGMSVVNGTARGTITSNDPVRGLSALGATSRQPTATKPDFYDGPVPALEWQFVSITPEALAVSVNTRNWFLRSGSGDDALDAFAGTNVLDGGTGSNFLSGGQDGDAFFLDIRDLAAAVWSTVTDFGANDTVTVWGITPDMPMAWQEGKGAPGYTGTTLVTTGPGGHVAALTLTGWTQSGLAAWKMATTFGHDPASGSDYMLIRHVYA